MSFSGGNVTVAEDGTWSQMATSPACAVLTRLVVATVTQTVLDVPSRGSAPDGDPALVAGCGTAIGSWVRCASPLAYKTARASKLRTNCLALKSHSN